MKYFLSIVFLLTGFLFAKAQNPCGTVFGEQMKQRLLEYNEHKNEAAGGGTDRVIRYIPIKFHIVGRDNGTGYYRKANLWKLLCELNDKFATTGFYFYIFGDLQYINNSDYYDLNFDTGDEMMNENNVAGVANVYIVNDPAGYCGYFTWGPDAVAVAKNCNAPGSTTLAHELGHYFSLPHPFDIVGTQKEYVNGSNCEYAGDLFCDTRADFLDYRWQCPYTGSETDPNGDVYDPDETLFMSYSYDVCQNRFSNEQMAAMNYCLTNERTDLLNHPVPDVAPINGVAHLNYPVDSADNIPNDWVQFNWDPVEGADYYHIEVTRAPTFGATPTETDVLVNDTYFTTVLPVDKKYQWRVLGLKNGYTCGTWSEPETFFTVMGTGITEPDNPSASLQVYPNLLTSGNQIFVSMLSTVSTAGTLCVVSSSGAMLEKSDISLVKGMNNLKINTLGYAAGLYLIAVVADGSIHQQKIIITK